MALFSALIYVLSWGTSYLPNVNLVFFIVFVAGVAWGFVPGMLVGAVGMGLWTLFNPFGPASPPVMAAQIAGTALSGVIGAGFALKKLQHSTGRTLTFALVAAACLCTLLFYVPVNLVDAWIFQPFWPRFVAGMIWSMISVVSNAVIFPVLFRPTRFLYNGVRMA
jgi:hypothetical protein